MMMEYQYQLVKINEKTAHFRTKVRIGDPGTMINGELNWAKNTDLHVYGQIRAFDKIKINIEKPTGPSIIRTGYPGIQFNGKSDSNLAYIMSNHRLNLGFSPNVENGKRAGDLFWLTNSSIMHRGYKSTRIGKTPQTIVYGNLVHNDGGYYAPTIYTCLFDYVINNQSPPLTMGAILNTFWINGTEHQKLTRFQELIKKRIWATLMHSGKVTSSAAAPYFEESTNSGSGNWGYRNIPIAFHCINSTAS